MVSFPHSYFSITKLKWEIFLILNPSVSSGCLQPVLKMSSVTMRFGKIELVRNQWRKFQFEIDTQGQYVNLPVPDPVTLNTLAVNLEENDQRQPIRYVSPPGIERQQQLSNNNVQLFMNEQALSLQFCGLPNKAIPCRSENHEHGYAPVWKDADVHSCRRKRKRCCDIR